MKAVAKKQGHRHDKCLESYYEKSGISLPLKEQKHISSLEFQSNVLSRMQKYSQKKEERLNNIKAEIKYKEKNESPFKPSLDKTKLKYKVTGTFMERLSRDNSDRLKGRS